MKKLLALSIVVALSVTTAKAEGLDGVEITGGYTKTEVNGLEYTGFTIGTYSELYQPNVDGLSLGLEGKLSFLTGDQSVQYGDASFTDSYHDEEEAKNASLGFVLNYQLFENDTLVIQPFATLGVNYLTASYEVNGRYEDSSRITDYKLEDEDSAFGIYYGAGVKATVAEHFIVKADLTKTTAEVFNIKPDTIFTISGGYKF